MKKFGLYICLAILGLVIGSASALYSSGLIGGKAGLNFTNLHINGWKSDWSIGSTSASPYTRARIARHGLLALAKEEAVYFTNRTDSDGQFLSESCVYQLTGTSQDAYWWSITLYDAESRLPMNSDAALSIDQTHIGNTDHWTALIAPTKPENTPFWISSKNAGLFDLTLRIYRPSEKILSQPETNVNAPEIKRLSCAGEM